MFWTKVAMGVGLFALTGCGGPEEVDRAGKRESQLPPVRVIAAPAAEVDWPETFEAPGTVRARMSATLSSRATGYVREVRFREGDRVDAGAVVVTLEARELGVAVRQAQAGVDEARSAVPEAESAIASASAQLALAETTLRRMQDLLNKSSVSQHEFDEADARVKVARSAKEMAEGKRRQLDQKIRQTQEGVAAAEVQLAYLDVKAPFAGRVTARKAEPGMLASPGMPLLELEREGGYRLEVAVPEARLRAVRAGQSVNLQIDAVNTPVSARVDEIVPEIDSATRSFLVKLALSGPELRGGLFGRAIFRTGSRKVLTVPSGAVVERGQLRDVLVISNGVAQSHVIRVGEQKSGAVEVLAGLTAGDLVISPRPASVTDGQRVEVAP